MKFRYRKQKKLNYGGTQYRCGDVLEMEEFDNSLPVDWFEVVEENEVIEKIEEPIKKEVITDGDNESPNENLGSKRRRSVPSKGV